MVDEKTRKCLPLEVGPSIIPVRVTEILTDLFVARGVPKRLRSDNGPELITSTVRRLDGMWTVESQHIAPGCPWENRVLESVHTRLGDDRVDEEVIPDPKNVRSLSRGWREKYNQQRPHSSLKHLPRADYAASPGAPTVGAALLHPARPAIGASFDSLTPRLK